jgi:hypothetical protein
VRKRAWRTAALERPHLGRPLGVRRGEASLTAIEKGADMLLLIILILLIFGFGYGGYRMGPGWGYYGGGTVSLLLTIVVILLLLRVI